MATVHLARQIDLDRLVALKRLDGLAEESDGRVRRFVREARLAASLSHPNTVTVHDAFEVAGVPYIAMELVPGGTLRELLTGLTLGQVAGGIKITDFGIAKATSVAHGDDGPLTTAGVADRDGLHGARGGGATIIINDGQGRSPGLNVGGG
jgi:hypothetical protein